MVATRFLTDTQSIKQPRVCANRGEFYKNTTTAAANSVRIENRKYFTLGGAPQAAIRLSYAGFYIPTTNVETNIGNDQTVEAGLEIVGSPNVTKVFSFAGAATGTIVNGAARYSTDWLYASDFGLPFFPAGMTFFVRDLRQVTSGQLFSRCPSTANMTGEGTYLSNGASASQVNAIGAMTVPASGSQINRCFGPICVEGLAQGVPDIAVLGIGDSLVEGVSDSNQPNGSDGSNGGGPLARALLSCGGRSVPLLQMAYAGTQVATLLPNMAKRRQYFPFVTHAIENYGTNDYASGGRSAAQIYIDRQTLWGAMRGAGAIRRIEAYPIFPRTSGAWTSINGSDQTPNSGYAIGGVFRDPMNANLAAAKAAGLIDDILDVTAPLVNPTAADKWIATGVAAYATADGTHGDSRDRRDDRKSPRRQPRQKSRIG